MARRRHSLAFGVLLTILRPTEEIALAQQAATAARLGLDAYMMPTLVELGLKPAVEPDAVVRNADRNQAWLRPSAATR